VHLTQNPSAHEQQNFTSALKDKGIDDAAILDVVLVTSISTLLIVWLWLWVLPLKNIKVRAINISY